MIDGRRCWQLAARNFDRSPTLLPWLPFATLASRPLNIVISTIGRPRSYGMCSSTLQVFFARNSMISGQHYRLIHAMMVKLYHPYTQFPRNVST